MAGFFSNLPNVYVGVETNETITYRLVKNLFRRVSLEDQLEKYVTAFEGYYIRDGERPDILADRFFGDSELDWIILITNNITDIYTQWPMDQSVLNEFTLEKYGNWDEVHHWETNQVLYNDAVFVKQGIEVNETYRVQLPDGTTLSKGDSIYPVSNIEYETYLNEKRRLIAIPNSTLVEFFEQQFAELVDYYPNKEVDPQGNKKTENSIVGRFLDRKSYRRSSSSPTQQSITSVTSFDYGPTTAGVTDTGTTTNASTVISSVSGSTTTSSSSSSSSSSGSSGY